MRYFFQPLSVYAIVLSLTEPPTSVRGFAIFSNEIKYSPYIQPRTASSRGKTRFSLEQLHSTNTNSVDTEDDDSEIKSDSLLQDAAHTLEIRGVTLKMAFDTTYAVADSSEDKSERFTCPESLDMVHKLRRWSDAVLVGRGTVQRDDCTLTVRRVPLLPQNKFQPVRVVIDPSLKIIEGANEYAMLQDGHKALIYHSVDEKDEGKENNFSHEGSNVELVKVLTEKNSSTEATTLSIKAILSDLYSRNIHHIMVEGGPATAIQFLRLKLVDRAILVRAPITFIEPVPSGMSNMMMKEAGLTLLQKDKCGDDIIEYWSKDGAPWPSIDGAFDDVLWPY